MLRGLLIFTLLLTSLSLCSCVKKGIGVEEKLKGDEGFGVNKEAEEKPTETPNEEKEAFIYDLDSAVIEENNIHVRYPVIKDSNDTQKELDLNHMIAQDITDLVSSQLSNAPEAGDLSLELDYTISGYADQVLSISYIGTSYIKDGLFPVNTYHTLNIDLNQGEKLILTDIVNINEELMKQFKEGAYFPYTDDLNLVASELSPTTIIEEQYTDEALISYFQNENAKFYLTDYEIVLSIEIPHVLGDHLEMGIPYEVLGSNKKAHSIWEEQ